jgi:hypothetical protein
MTTGASCLWGIDAVSLITLGVAGFGVSLLLLDHHFATEHGTHKRALHPVRMRCHEGALFGSFSAAVAARCAFAFFGIIAHYEYVSIEKGNGCLRSYFFVK